MEAFIIFLLIAILAVPIILLVWFKVSISSLIRETINKMNSLHVKVDKLEQIKETKKVVPEEDNVSINESLLTLMEALPEEELPSEVSDFKEENEAVDEVRKRWEEEKLEKEAEKIKQVIPEKKIIPEKITKKKPKQAAFVKPKKEKRDIEKFIGENLINKIGIGVLVLGIAFFVRYAIDKNWISEVGRVAIGILSGGVLTFLAHKIRKAYKAFSSVLVGGALAVFYYTISIGFHDYQLFSQPVAFAIMVLITGFSVLLSISYDKKELAILALIGAFSTPLMVSNGAGNYIVLFTYLAIVNVGMLVLAYFKKWNVINILSFAFTILLYGAWFLDDIVFGGSPPYQGAFIYASIFYVIFFFMHIVNNVKEKRKFKGYEFGLMLGTTALFYAAGMSILYLSGYDKMQGLFTISLGVFNLLFAYPLFRKNKVDKSLVFLLIGMVLTFVSLAAPVQLSGNYITMFWVTEMIVLLWLGQKSNIKFMKFSSLVILALMLISLVMDWQQVYFDYGVLSLPIILNKGFITTAFSIVGLWVYIKVLKQEKEESLLPKLPVLLIKNIAKIIIGTLIYFLGVMELSFQLDHRITYGALSTLSVIGFTYVFIIGLSIYAKNIGNVFLEKGLTVICMIALVTYPLFNGLEQIIRDDYLMGKVYVGTMLVQYVNLILISVIGFQFIKNIQKWYGLRSDMGKVAVWGVSVIGLIVASMQLNQHTVLFFFDQAADNMRFINKQTIKIGYPIVWGISSFIMMLLGMKYNYRALRVISLSTFSVILLKLFMFDIKGASEAGKIVAFILLGVILLVISFMYQKLKNLILDNGSDNK
jgi:uncharacterized membrane protein